jgi:hypothetical protein
VEKPLYCKHPYASNLLGILYKALACRDLTFAAFLKFPALMYSLSLQSMHTGYWGTT